MSSENTPKGRMQITLACTGALVVMLLAAGALFATGGSHGLKVPSSGGQASRH